MGSERLTRADHLASMHDKSVYRVTIARMFKHPVLELMSKVHPLVPALLYMPLVLWFGYVALSDIGLGGVGTLLGGAFVWTFAEYTLHRFLFHFDQSTHWGRFFYYYSHGIHHAYPDDYFRLVMVPPVSIPFALLFYGLFVVLLPTTWVAGFFSGFIFGYLIYDYTHFATHHVRPPSHPALKWLAAIMKEQRRRHMIHHFKETDRGYGVSTAFWDHVFRTPITHSK